MPDLPHQTEKPWHSLPAEEFAVLLQTDLDHGLSEDEAQSRLERYGPNSITSRRGKSSLRLLLDQFTQILVLILIVSGAVTAILGAYVDSAVIFGVVIINAIVGYLQEAKAVQAIEALSRSMTSEATVVRDGQRLRLSAERLVPGDLVVLQAGDKIPADLRLTYSRDLRIDESALTGESVPVEKITRVLAGEAGLADRANMAYASTLATGGQGNGVVVATGDSTEVGKISGLIASAEELKTPLTRKIAHFSRILLYVIIALAVITAVVGILRGEPVVDMFVAAVALAVGAIPEGLPAAMTIVLAIGVSRMAQRRAIIRRLPAVETLGSTTVICSDKTGTLTENQMTVQQAVAGSHAYEFSGTGYDPDGHVLRFGEAVELDDSADLDGGIDSRNHLSELLRAGLLCNDSNLYCEGEEWRISGDPTEAALIVSAVKAGLDREALGRAFPRLDTVPFESAHQYMATLHDEDRGDDGASEDRIVYVKGALEQVLSRSTHQWDGRVLDDSDRASIEDQAHEMASEGLRILAFASKHVPASVDEITHADVESDLVFIGLQGMIDPPRAEVIPAIRACEAAGVQVKMITGDHVATASAIARRLNLRRSTCDEQVDPAALTGMQLAAIEDSDLVDAAEETIVFARVSPEQKLRLVRALQSRGHVVAMTGDGVNDGPALRQADIGVSMGLAGTEVAKEASDMVLTDDNFASIEAAVEEGRGVFDNLTKFIAWTLPTNLSEGLIILAAVFAGTLLPILPAQILWINMATAVLLGATLTFEPKEAGIMSRQPRSPQTPLLESVLIQRIVLVGIMLLAGAFGLFQFGLETGQTIEEARTLAVNVIVFGEIFYLFNCRSLTQPWWAVGVFSNRILLGGAAIMAALQMLFTYLPPMNSLFHTAPLPASEWIWIVVVGVGIHLVVEVEKWIRRMIAGRKGEEPIC